MKIVWHPICDHVDIKPFKGNAEEWIRPVLCPPLKKGEQCYIKFNYFIDTQEIRGGDYYGFMGDDDMYEPGFFDQLRLQTAKIIINSNYRGDAIPDDGSAPHGTTPLIMRFLSDIRVNNIGLGMFFVKGVILKQTRFSSSYSGGDGRYAEELKRRWPRDIKILSDWFVFGNYFQPGRFTCKECFLKDNWELPKIV